MKKSIKSLLAVMLVCVMAFSVFGAGLAFADAPATYADLRDAGFRVTPATDKFVESITIDGVAVALEVYSGTTVEAVIPDDANFEDTDEVVITYADVEADPEGDSSNFTMKTKSVLPADVATVNLTTADGKVTVEVSGVASYATYMYSIVRYSSGAYFVYSDSFKPYENFTVENYYKLNVSLSLSATSYVYGENPPELVTNIDSLDGYSVDADLSFTAGSDAHTKNVVFDVDEVTVTGDADLVAAELNLDDSAIPATISVTNRAITVSANEVNKAYDGEAAVITGVDKSHKLASGDQITAAEVVGGPIKNATEDTYNIDASAVVIKNGSTDVTELYDITPDTVYIKITKPAITIAATNPAAVVYDGAVHNGACAVSNGTLPSGYTVEAAYTATATNAGETSFSLTANSGKVYDADHNDVTANFTVTTDATTTAKIVISKAELTVKAKDMADKPNSVLPLTVNESATTEAAAADLVTVTGLVGTDKVTEVKVTSPTANAAGDVVLTPSAVKVMNGSNDVTANYTIVPQTGKVKVLPDSSKPTITVKLGGTKVYDGKTMDAYKVTLDATATANRVKVTVLGATIKNVADSKTLTAGDVTVTVSDPSNNNVTSSYNVVVESGEAKITKQTLNIKLDSLTKAYDGAQYVGSINKSAKFGDTTLTITGSAYPYAGTEKKTGVGVGTYAIKVDLSSVVVKNSSGDDVTGNFAISGTDAVLKVTATIGKGSYSKSAGGTIVISCSVPLSDFVDLYLDNDFGHALVKDTDYTVKSGSTIVTLNNSYLRDLPVGTHTLTYRYANAGDINTTLVVTATGATTSTNAVQSGDNNNLGMWIAIAVVCAVVAVAIVTVLVVNKIKTKREA